MTRRADKRSDAPGREHERAPGAHRVVRHVPRNRESAPSTARRIRGLGLPHSRCSTGPTPQTCSTSLELPGVSPIQTTRFPEERHLPRHLLTCRERGPSGQRDARASVPVVCELGRGAEAFCSVPTWRRKQRRHVLDYDDLLLYWLHLMQDGPAEARGAGSIMCWWTNTKTRTRSRPESCSA